LWLGIELMRIVLFEPTSVAKASVIFEDPVKLGVYPAHSIDLITPNLYELKAMFKAAEKKHLFEGIEWWDMLDSFNLTSQFRQGTITNYINPLVHANLNADVEFLMRKVSRQHRHRSLDDPQELEYNIESHVPQDEHELKLGRDLMGEGALQQAVALLPYIPNVVVKLGSLGILCVRLCPKDTQLKDTDASTLRFPGRKADVVVQHHRGLPQKGFVSVTGAGYDILHIQVWAWLIVGIRLRVCLLQNLRVEDRLRRLLIWRRRRL